MKNNRKGFTLAELLIVVAIIAVLVAVAIPVFTAQLEKSREATDLSNIRAAYAECSAALLSGTDDTTSGVKYNPADGTNRANATKTIQLGQTQKGWQTDNETKIAGITLKNLKFEPTGNKGQDVTITVYEGATGDQALWTLTGSGTTTTPGEGG